LAGGRSCLAGSCANRVWSTAAAGAEGDDQDCRALAAVARRGGAPVVELLPRGKEARRRAGATQDAIQDASQRQIQKAQTQRSCAWPLNWTDRDLRRAPVQYGGWWCSCMATVPTATI